MLQNEYLLATCQDQARHVFSFEPNIGIYMYLFEFAYKYPAHRGERKRRMRIQRLREDVSLL